MSVDSPGANRATTTTNGLDSTPPATSSPDATIREAKQQNYVTRWMNAVLTSRELSSAHKAIGIAFSTFADYTTGENVYPSEEKVADFMGLTPKSIRAGVKALRDAKFIECVQDWTAKGHTKRYRLTFPESTERLRVVQTESAEPLREKHRTFTSIAPPVNGWLPTHDLPTTQIAAASLRDGAVADLAKQAAAAGLTARFDRLKQDDITEILQLIEHHGIGKLVRRAQRDHRADDPAAFAQAWLPGWRQLPEAEPRKPRPAEPPGIERTEEQIKQHRALAGLR